MGDERSADSLPVGMTRRGLRGRRLARLMFVSAIAPVALLALLFLAAPQTMGPDPGPSVQWFAAAGVALYVLGVVWMIRIYRLDPEAHQSFWRSNRN
jgi:membrane protein YdbS with pleckstrin-like domain